jgi:hypothetical protein
MLLFGTLPADQNGAETWVTGTARAFGWEAVEIPDADRAQIGQKRVRVRRVLPGLLRTRKDFAGYGAYLFGVTPEPVRRTLRLDLERELRQRFEGFNAPFKPTIRGARDIAEARTEATRQLKERNAEAGKAFEAITEFDQGNRAHISGFSEAASVRLRDAVYERYENRRRQGCRRKGTCAECPTV